MATVSAKVYDVLTFTEEEVLKTTLNERSMQGWEPVNIFTFRDKIFVILENCHSGVRAPSNVPRVIIGPSHSSTAPLSRLAPEVAPVAIQSAGEASKVAREEAEEEEIPFIRKRGVRSPTICVACDSIGCGDGCECDCHVVLTAIQNDKRSVTPSSVRREMAEAPEASEEPAAEEAKPVLARDAETLAPGEIEENVEVESELEVQGEVKLEIPGLKAASPAVLPPPSPAQPSTLPSVPAKAPFIAKSGYVIPEEVRERMREAGRAQFQKQLEKHPPVPFSKSMDQPGISWTLVRSCDGCQKPLSDPVWAWRLSRGKPPKRPVKCGNCLGR